MSTLSKFISLFTVVADEDISTNEVFKQSFLNVVNSFLIVYSFFVGVHALLLESSTVAIAHFCAAVFFLAHFVFAYLLRQPKQYNIINRGVIFLYFIIMLLSSSVTRFCGVSMLMYPFLAIILHGRQVGVTLSILQIIIAAISYEILQHTLPSLGLDFTLYEILTLCAIQVVGTFVYLVAIRWISEMLYDKIRQVMELTEDVKVQKELTEHLAQTLRVNINDIEKSSQKLSTTNLSPIQAQMASTVRISAATMNQKMDSVLNASKYCIRPLGEEETIFNLHTLVTTTLLLYAQNMQKIQQGHSVVLSSEMPQQVLGNSIVSKQILLAIFDSLDHKLGLRDRKLVVTLSLCDTNVQSLVVNFAISLYIHLDIDHRDLSSIEEKLINSLGLLDAYRLAEATESNFSIEYVSNVLTIQFTQSYKDIDAIVLPDADLLNEKRTFNELMRNNQPVLTLRDMSMLIVSFDDITDRLLVESLLGKVGKVEVAASARSALNRFENSCIDIVVVSMSQHYEMSTLELAKRIRSIEQGIGHKSIIISIDPEPLKGDAKLEAMESGIDVFAHYPNDIAHLHEIIKELIEN